MTSRPYRHELRVRYGEVDMQRHVFNAHYLAYIDDAFDQWLRGTLGPTYDTVLDIVVKRAELTWDGGASFGDTLAIDVSVRRWGTTSFDVGFEGSVGERPIFDATLTYIAVEPGSTTPTPVPDEVRAALG
jgi:acyl-CoA thioester hydrolase